MRVFSIYVVLFFEGVEFVEGVIVATLNEFFGLVCCFCVFRVLFFFASIIFFYE